MTYSLDLRERTKRTTLIMAQRGKEWLAPLLFQGSSAAMTIERWIEKGLLPLPPYSPDLNPI
jgi:transposase